MTRRHTSRVGTTAALLLLIGITTSARSNIFRDKLLLPLTAEQSAQLSLVGALERLTPIAAGKTKREHGSAVLVSPCYVLTNHHVAFGEDEKPVMGKAYEMVFRAGAGDDEQGFAGHTSATPAVWGQLDKRGRGDWAIMKLGNCVGGLAAFGWLEATRFSQDRLVERGVLATTVGYTDNSRLMYSTGHFHRVDAISGMMQYDGSMAHGMSGGASLVMEDGVAKLVGLATGGLRGIDDQSDTFPSWTADRSNLVMGASEILNRPEVRQMLDADKAAFGRPNPALERLRALSPLYQ